MKKLFLLILLVFFYSCETPLNDIVVYSGYWTVICTNPSNFQFPEFTIVVKDNGTFRNKANIYSNIDTVFVMGTIDNNGVLVGQFGDSLGTYKYGDFSGNFYEESGIRYGTGTWNDTLHSPNSYGKWKAKSN